MASMNLDTRLSQEKFVKPWLHRSERPPETMIIQVFWCPPSHVLGPTTG